MRIARKPTYTELVGGFPHPPPEGAVKGGFNWGDDLKIARYMPNFNSSKLQRLLFSIEAAQEKDLHKSPKLLPLTGYRQGIEFFFVNCCPIKSDALWQLNIDFLFSGAHLQRIRLGSQTTYMAYRSFVQKITCQRVNGVNSPSLINIQEHTNALKWRGRFGGEKGSSSDAIGRGRGGKGELLASTIQLRYLVLTRHPVHRPHRHPPRKPRHLRCALYPNFRTSTL